MKKYFFFCLILLFLANNANAAITIFSDDFSSGTLTGYDTNSGTWSAATNQLVGGALDGAALSHAITMLPGADYNISFRNDPNVASQLAHFDFFTDNNGIGNVSGYNIMLQGNGNARLRRMTNGVATNLISGGTITIGTMRDVNLNIDGNGWMVLIVDGNLIGTAYDSTYTRGTKFFFSSENAAFNAFWDNLIITSDENYLPLIDVNFFNYGTDTSTGRKYVNTLNYTLGYTCYLGQNAIISRYVNSLNDQNQNVTCDQSSHTISGSYQHPTNGSNFLIDFNIFDAGRTSTVADTNYFSDRNAPLIDINFSSSTSGFGPTLGTVTAYLTCRDGVSPKNNYDLNNFTTSTSYINGSFDSNSTRSSVANVAAGDNIFAGACTDLAGNTTNDVNTVNVNGTCFNLVKEDSGADWSGADINSTFTVLKATAYSNASSYDFKANADNDICYTSIIDDTIRFDLNYANGLSIYREFNLGIIVDVNVTTAELNVCVATPQDLFEQLFISAQLRPVVVQNIISECYSLMDYTKYAYQDALSHRAFTISMPYQLTTFDDGNAVNLTIVNGASESQTQLDVLLFKAQQVALSLQPDELTISPYYSSTSASDTNTVQVSYRNIQADNTLVNIKIYDGSTLLINRNYTASPNEFVDYFDFTGITITNEMLKLVLTKTKTNGENETINRYFTLNGPIVFPAALGAILALLFFLFFFTVVGWKSSLGIVGIGINGLALGILTLVPSAGWVIILQAFFLIGILYLGIIKMNETGFGG